MKDHHPVQFRRKKLEGFPNIRLFSTKLGHRTTSRVAGWEAGDRMPPDDEITKMAPLFSVSPETLKEEIIAWNRRHPELLQPVTVWKRVERAQSNGSAPALTEPQTQPAAGTDLSNKGFRLSNNEAGFQYNPDLR